MKKLINSMIENMTSFKQLPLLSVTLNMLFIHTLTSKLVIYEVLYQNPIFNEGINFINLQSILRDNSVESSMPEEGFHIDLDDCLMGLVNWYGSVFF